MKQTTLEAGSGFDNFKIKKGRPSSTAFSRLWRRFALFTFPS
jgi:hypothetical protein